MSVDTRIRQNFGRFLHFVEQVKADIGKTVLKLIGTHFPPNQIHKSSTETQGDVPSRKGVTKHIK